MTIVHSPITFEACGHTIRGLITSADENRAPSVLFLHGAGASTKERAQPLADLVADQGHAVLSFDFVGHGETGGEAKGTTLAMRLEQAVAATAIMASGKICVFGFSMGGHVALRLLPLREVGALVLFYPAVYPDAAEHAGFGPLFSAAIRIPRAWRKSSAFSGLREFTGDLRVFIGEDDEVIPDGLVERIVLSATSAASASSMRIPGADHKLLPYLAEHPDAWRNVSRSVATALGLR